MSVRPFGFIALFARADEDGRQSHASVFSAGQPETMMWCLFGGPRRAEAG